MDFRTFRCRACGFRYDELAGSASEGIAPGTRWDDLPEDWFCPECGSEKPDFDVLED